MSNYKKTLDLYTESLLKLRQFESKHIDVFSKYNLIKESIENYQKILKELALDEKRDIENDTIKVKFSQPFKKWYDYQLVVKNSTPEELQIIMSEAVNVEIDRDKAEKLVKEEKLRPIVLQKAFKEEPMTSRVTIQQK